MATQSRCQFSPFGIGKYNISSMVSENLLRKIRLGSQLSRQEMGELTIQLQVTGGSKIEYQSILTKNLKNY